MQSITGIHVPFETRLPTPGHSAALSEDGYDGTMSENGRKCANCVFWSPRNSRDGQAPGRCRARLLESPDPRQGFMTQADFVCRQWCEQASATAAE